VGGKRKAGGTAQSKARATTGKTGKKTPKKPLTRWGRVRRVLMWLGVSGLVLALLVAGGLVYLYRTTDLPDPNADFDTETSFVYYNDGKTEIGQYAVQNRVRISYSEIPEDVKDAVVAAENRGFWTDNGIDPKGIIRALFNNAQGNATQGASTITQQYIKIYYLNQERSYSRKLKEALLAVKLVRQRTKEQILDGYLNTIYYGRGAYGIQAAALAYFQKDAKDLDLRQSAVLASVINNPTRFDPANGRDAKRDLRERYRYVLGGMAEAKAISAEEADQAAQRLPAFPPQKAENAYGGQRGHVLKMVRDALLRLTDENGDPLLNEDEIDGGGLRVTTTFTKKAMDAAEQGVLEARPEGFSDKELHVGVASVEPGTGAVRGIYGGQDYLDSQLNWAVAGGQAGSSLKPFALAAGIKEGFSLKDTFDGNSPIVLPDGTEIENQGNESYGSAINLITATENSVNTAFTDLTMSIPDGPEKIVKMMNAMGIPPKDPKGSKRYGIPDHTLGLEPVVSVALGSATVSPINMANGFATIANGGRMAAPYIIENVVGRDGEPIYDHRVSDRQVIDAEQGEDIAADVSYALQQVVQSGSGTAALGLGRPAAGKTGTSTNDVGDVVSAWFTGYTPQLATSVVYLRGKGVGKLDGWLPSFFGGAYPADTWTAVMTRAMEGLDVEEFPPPAYVDGEAPDDGHSPTPPPPTRTPQPSDTPSETETPSETTEPSTPAPTTSAPPSPPPSPPPPSPTDCSVITCPSSSAPPSSPPPSSPTPTQSQTAASSAPPRPKLFADRRSWLTFHW
jgi:membrane peptidoglycan carboxypeptidase